MTIKGKHVYITSCTVQHHLIELFNAFSKIEIKNLVFFSKSLTVARQEKYISRMEESPTDYLFVIKEVGTGRLVGTIGLHEHDVHHNNIRYGGMVFPEYKGKGYGSEATRLILGYAFNELKVNKVHINAFPTNDGLIALCAKLCFRFDGILREHYFLNEKYHDMYHFSKLRKEWKNE